MKPQNEPSGEDELSRLLSLSAKVLCKSGDPEAFLDWIAEAGSTLAPGMGAMNDPKAGPVDLLFRSLGVHIYNAMPLPDAGFRPRPLREPGRNEPCFCGSGQKYKRCCLPLAGMLDLRNYNMLRHVIDWLPKKAYATLAKSHVDVSGVYDTARQWTEEGDAERAAALLEPWFAGRGALPGKLAPLFDQLMESYLVLGRPRKRERLVAAAMARGDRTLRASALQRHATMLADRGQMQDAWARFREAQREDPDDPALAVLEISLLMASRDTTQARERAKFWIARLERSRDPDFADMIGFLREVVDDPERAVAQSSREMHPALDRLAGMLETAPPIEPHYVVERIDQEALLKPDRALAAVEARWRKAFPQAKPPLTATQHDSTEMWINPDEWLELLDEQTLAWQSFDVLDDLSMAVEVLQAMGTDKTMLEPLLDRGIALLKATVAAGDATGATLSWAAGEHRPALRMLAHRLFRAYEENPQSAGFLQLAEWLIALNPHDNHGVREYLSHAYLAAGTPEKTIALSKRYPNDFCGMALNHILALYRVERHDDALAALRDAARHHAVAIDMLVADRPKQPRATVGYTIQLGGKEEAWEYRAAHLELWQQGGALEWLREAWGSVRSKAR